MVREPIIRLLCWSCFILYSTDCLLRSVDFAICDKGCLTFEMSSFKIRQSFWSKAILGLFWANTLIFW